MRTGMSRPGTRQLQGKLLEINILPHADRFDRLDGGAYVQVIVRKVQIGWAAALTLNLPLTQIAVHF